MKVEVPWDEQTVENLNQYQQYGQFHPYTCGKNSNHILIATTEGWVCPYPECGYTQNWAHDYTAR